MRVIDGGKLVKGVKLFAVRDKHGSLLDLELRPANTDDRAGTMPMLPRLAALGFEGDLLGDSGFKGALFAAAVIEHDIHVSISPGGTCDGRFLPNAISSSRPIGIRGRTVITRRRMGAAFFRRQLGFRWWQGWWVVGDRLMME